MKRYFILPSLLAMALALTNCAKTEVTASYDPSDDLDVINVSLATAKNLTRAADAATSTLETAATSTNFNIHVVSEATTPTIYGYDLYFKYASSTWTQVANSTGTGMDSDAAGELRWSSIEMPARFYSLFVGNADDSSATNSSTTAGISNSGTSIALSSTYNVMDTYDFTQSDAATEAHNHKDLVYAAQDVTSTPVGGKVTMTFSHILSKVDIYVATEYAANGVDNTAYIQSVKLVNVFPKATLQPEYSRNSPVSTTALWSAASGTAVSYGYFLNDQSTEASASWSGDKELIQTDANGAMIIVPQTLTGLNVDSDGSMALPTDSGNEGKSYVEVIYYSTDVNNGSFAGYKAASESWTYEPSHAGDVITEAAVTWDAATSTWLDSSNGVVTYYDDATSTWYDGTDVGNTAVAVTATTEGYFAYPAATDALYVKVGFPFDATNGQVFESGKYYNLILGMGSKDSSSGYLLEKNFYDKDGNKLPVVVNEQVIEPGDPIAPDADGTIGIVVLVSDWDDATEVVVYDEQDQAVI